MKRPSMGEVARVAPLVLGGLALAFVAGLTISLVARPIATEDFWFHLKMGETYFTQGLWPQVDPLLHTSTRPPFQHEWLFGVFAWGVVKLFGFFGWRLVHTLFAVGTVALVLFLARKAAGAGPAAALGTIVFLLFAQPRLMQARPDLISIASAFSLYALLWASERVPTTTRLVCAAGILLVWANMHSLFAIGLALLTAATCGAWFEERIARSLADPPPASRLWKRLALALLLGGVVTLLNPRGLSQHLTFFSYSKESDMWAIADEWTPFDPLGPTTSPNGTVVHPLPWLVMDALLVLFPLTFLLQYVSFKRAPTGAHLRTLAPRLFLPAAASLGAVLISSRFMWLGLLPVLYVLNVLRERGLLGRPAANWTLSGTAVVLAASFVGGSGWLTFIGDTPPLGGGYFTQGYNLGRYPDAGVRFLSTAGLSGNLFNHYTLGGYLGYRLSPSLRTFIDGRTEHYAPSVRHDYHHIIDYPQEQRLELLDRYRVDVFFGFGGELTGYKGRADTLRLLRRAPGWVLIFRTLDQALYLRDDPRNASNLANVEAYYRERGIPFDRQAGLDVSAVLKAAPEWAVEQGLVPRNYRRLLALVDDPSAPMRAPAARTLARFYRGLDDETDLARVLSIQ